MGRFCPRSCCPDGFFLPVLSVHDLLRKKAHDGSVSFFLDRFSVLDLRFISFVNPY